jgi:hypothetical protein
MSLKKIVRTLLPVALIASLLLGVGAPSALAAEPAPGIPDRYQVRCQDDACTLQVDLDRVSELARFGAGLAATLLQSQTSILPEGSSIQVDDALVLTLPTGDLALPNADVTLELGQENRIRRLHGTAEIALPRVGLLGDAQVNGPAMADVGLDLGENLDYLDLPLQAGRQYLVFRLGTGLDIAGQAPGPDGAAAPFELSLPGGQNATLVIDTVEPLVYIAGNITLNHNGPIALVADVFTPGDGVDLSPGDLPIRRQTDLHLSGLLGGDKDQSYVTVGGGYAVDGGAISDALGVDVAPLTVQGLLTASPAGLLLQGRLQAQVQPDRVFAGDVQVAAFVPFSTESAEPYVRLDGQAVVPAAHVRADVAAAWSPSQSLAVDASLATPWSEGHRVAVDTPRTRDSVEPTVPAGPSPVQRFLAGLSDRASQGVIVVRDATGRGYAWIAAGAGAGSDAVAQWLASLRKAGA